jgi:putative tricarboxylic transport membrane protein
LWFWEGLMQAIQRQTAIGIATVLAALFLVFFAIPNWVSSPSNVPNIILSPLFWPYSLAGFTALVGIGLILTGLRSVDAPVAADPEVAGGYRRLAIMAAIMVIYMFGLPRLGMVWTSMLAFAATAFLVKTHHPKTAIASAIMVPLLLYVFFAHVAFVAIPQGVIVRLP